MYIEYVTPQRVADLNITEYNSKGGSYRPTWLIRTSDWEKVPGTNAVDGYHALSYCWEQSGKIKKRANEEPICIDKGRHRIKTVVEKRSASTFFRKHKATKVTYERLLQQICKDFDIEYLWYDKICINQANKAEKHREIKQMHLVYSNARYTVALVPEVNIDDPEQFDSMDWMGGNIVAKLTAMVQTLKSRWFQRSWTLEELMMSTQILVIGRNTHFWSLADIKQGQKLKENDFMANTMLGFKERTMKSANQVLRYAHLRTSANEHDKIFALANIFADSITIDVNYDSDVLALMAKFYRRLAQKDLSLMCFGSPLNADGHPGLTTTMRSYHLPSWTGVAGLHAAQPVADITLDKSCDYTVDENMVLHIRCRYHTIRPNIRSMSDFMESDERKKKAEKNYYKMVGSMDDFGDESEALDWSHWILLRAAGGSLTHYYKPEIQAQFLLPVLPLSLTEGCDECVILGVVFNSVKQMVVNGAFAGYRHTYISPVARKIPGGSSHKIIGMVILKYFQIDEPRTSPQAFMDKMFSIFECKAHDFLIK